MIRHPSLLLLLLLSLLSAGCGSQSGEAAAPRGRILLWHGLDGVGAEVLDDLLTRFMEINPEAEILSLAVTPETLRSRYEETASLGLGPDLLLGPATWSAELGRAGLIRQLSRADFGGNDYVAPAVLAARDDEAMYGLPLSVAPLALYYDRSLVAIPPATLDELLAEAEAGREVAMSSRFDQAYWGIAGFGGGLFDLAGDLALADSGFAGWLGWLKLAQEAPGVILLRDGDVLQDLFVSERVVYFVAGPERLEALREAVPAERLGVAPLPAGPAGPTASLVRAQVGMINTASSENQARLALALAQFLSNAEQSMILMRGANLVPANRRLQADARVFPLLSSFMVERVKSVAVPNDLPLDTFYEMGDAIYANVLAGVLSPEEAVCQFARDVRAMRGRPTDAVLPPGCADDG